ncbi:hypothetical protein [Caballeronia sp. ATUFL_M2_KS44]|uniref:hypothetical protein n=1 Tax=Caballeronia sp. ATUFL_M2_KS44 TaxID=2921767 RepID=UPI00202959DD|nr:hypothetical protein [Caballeronia sp. ATUFL_M2_KS44]
MSLFRSIRQAVQQSPESLGIASLVLVPVFFAMSFVILAAFAVGLSRSCIVLAVSIAFVACMLLVTCILFTQSSRYKTARDRCAMSMPLHEFGQTKAYRRDVDDNNASRDDLRMQCNLCRSEGGPLCLGGPTSRTNCEDRNEKSA